MADVTDCLEALRAGESYELCLTTMLRRNGSVCARRLYSQLRASNPAAHAAWLSFGGGVPTLSFGGGVPTVRCFPCPSCAAGLLLCNVTTPPTVQQSSISHSRLPVCRTQIPSSAVPGNTCCLRLCADLLLLPRAVPERHLRRSSGGSTHQGDRSAL